MLKRFLTITVMLVSFIGFTSVVSAAMDGLNLFNHVGNEVENLEDNKAYKTEKVLVKVDEYKQSTTVDKLLTTARAVLSPPQYKIFVLPLALTALQKTPYAAIKVNGTVMSGIAFSPTIPADLTGLGSVVLDYSGETTLVRQVMANLQAEEKQKSPTVGIKTE